MGRGGRFGPGCNARWSPAQDRHAFDDERDLVSAANRLPIALLAARRHSTLLDGLQRHPRVSGRRYLASALGSALSDAARAWKTVKDRPWPISSTARQSSQQKKEISSDHIDHRSGASSPRNRRLGEYPKATTAPFQDVHFRRSLYARHIPYRSCRRLPGWGLKESRPSFGAEPTEHRVRPFAFSTSFHDIANCL